VSETPLDVLRDALKDRRLFTEELLESYEARLARAVWIDRAEVMEVMSEGREA
jgi:hypothetical protein